MSESNLIPEGQYLARAYDAALGKASTGTQQVAVAFLIKEGPGQGKRRTWYGYFTEASAERTLKSLRACGWKGNKLTDLSTVGSRDCLIVIGHEADERNGEVRDRVQWVNALGAAVSNPLDRGEAALLSKKMAGLAAKIDNPPDQPDTQFDPRNFEDGDPGPDEFDPELGI